MRQIFLLSQAQEDLDPITNPLFGSILRRLEALREFPELGSPMTGPFKGYRSTLVEFFRIVYKTRPNGEIVVAYIRHCKRKPLA